MEPHLGRGRSLPGRSAAFGHQDGDMAGAGERGHHGARACLHRQSGDSNFDWRVRGHHKVGALFLPRALLGADPLGDYPGEYMRFEPDEGPGP